MWRLVEGSFELSCLQCGSIIVTMDAFASPFISSENTVEIERAIEGARERERASFVLSMTDTTQPWFVGNQHNCKTGSSVRSIWIDKVVDNQMPVFPGTSTVGVLVYHSNFKCCKHNLQRM